RMSRPAIPRLSLRISLMATRISAWEERRIHRDAGEMQYMTKGLKFLAAIVGVVFVSGICVGQTASFSSQATADAFADSSQGDSNFGAAGSLAVSANNPTTLPQGEFQSALRFDLSGAANSFNTQFGVGGWTLQSVTLQLTASPHGNPIFNNVAAGQFNVSLM